MAIAKQRARRHTLPVPAKVWNLLLDALIGHGYRARQAGLWLLGFLARRLEGVRARLP